MIVMPRCKRNIVKAGTYHIMVRGVNKQDIFYDDKDKEMFVRLLYYYKKKLECKIHAYCLMPNHVHILFKDKEELISDFMRNIASVYAYEFNQKHKRVGHLFQDRFKSIYVYNDEYLLRLIRYIHRNPEKAGICKTEEYKWSSYTEYLYNNNIIEKDFILEKFDKNKNIALKNFIKFVNDKDEEELDELYLKEKLTDKEAIELIKRITKLENLSNIKKYNKKEKEKILYKILKINNIKESQIARILGMSKNFKSRMGKKGPDPFFPENDKILQII